MALYHKLIKRNRKELKQAQYFFDLFFTTTKEKRAGQKFILIRLCKNNIAENKTLSKDFQRELEWLLKKKEIKMSWIDKFINNTKIRRITRAQSILESQMKEFETFLQENLN